MRIAGYTVSKPHYPTFDISDPVAVADYDLSDYQHLVLCNGYAQVSDLREQSYAQITKIIFDNLIGSIYMTKKFLQDTSSTEGPKRVVTIGSHSAEWPNRWLGPYCAAKAGLNQFVKCMQREWGGQDYYFFCINPGPIVDTNFQNMMVKETSALMKIEPEDVITMVETRSGINKQLTAKEVGSFAAQLACGKFDWLAGNPIPFTGGQR
jgi:NAD(P)-dependent dehydrogenase (short-subunit alcohol dehydrogenase family)